MKAICFSKLLSLTVFAGLILVVPGAAYSQAPPGPVPAGQPQPVPASAAKPQEQSPPPRTTILGAAADFAPEAWLQKLELAEAAPRGQVREALASTPRRELRG